MIQLPGVVRFSKSRIAEFHVTPADSLELRVARPTGFFGRTKEITVASMKVEKYMRYNTAVVFELEDGSLGGYFTWEDR
jgi:hypothetical protein